MSTRNIVATAAATAPASSPTIDITGMTYSSTIMTGNDGEDIVGMFYNYDGTKLLLCDNRRFVYQYALSTAYDISTVNTTHDTRIEWGDLGVDEATGGFMSADGWFMYIVDHNRGDGSIIWQFELVTQGVISGGVELLPYQLSLSAYDRIRGLWVSPDGDFLYLSDWRDDVVAEIPLSTPYDLSTTGTATEFSVGAIDQDDVWLNPSGTTMLITTDARDLANVIQYDLSTAYDISTAAHVVTVLVGDRLLKATAQAIVSTDATKLWVAGKRGLVLQYNLV